MPVHSISPCQQNILPFILSFRLDIPFASFYRRHHDSGSPETSDGTPWSLYGTESRQVNSVSVLPRRCMSVNLEQGIPFEDDMGSGSE